MIIDLRGPNGSGKTWVMEQMRKMPGTETALCGPGLLPASQQEKAPETIWAIALYLEALADPLYLVGPYSRRGHGQGVDKVMPMDEVTARVEYLARHGHVAFEGVIASTIFGRFFDTAMRHPGAYTVIQLTTPLELCLERIRDRRQARGTDPGEFKAELVEDKIKAIGSACDRFRTAGVRVISSTSERAPTTIMEALGGDQIGLGLGEGF